MYKKADEFQWAEIETKLRTKDGVRYSFYAPTEKAAGNYLAFLYAVGLVDKEEVVYIIQCIREHEDSWGKWRTVFLCDNWENILDGFLRKEV